MLAGFSATESVTIAAFDVEEEVCWKGFVDSRR